MTDTADSFTFYNVTHLGNAYQVYRTDYVVGGNSKIQLHSQHETFALADAEATRMNGAEIKKAESK